MIKKKQNPIVIEPIANEYLAEVIRVIKQSNPDYPYHALRKQNLLPILEELLARRLNLDYDLEDI